MIRLESGLERKKAVCCSLGESVGVLQGQLKIEQRADSFNKMCHMFLSY